MHYIYKITNIVNQKIYIGQTNNPNSRWSNHKSKAKCGNNNLLITRAMIKYGIEFFVFEVIATTKNLYDANILEAEVINQYNGTDKQIGYNVGLGGNTSPRTEEWKNNISKSSIGKPGTNAGKVFSDEWKNNISKSLVGTELKERRRFAEEVEMQICDLYVNSNKSTYFLGKQFNCNRPLIINILIRHNIKMRKSNYTGHRNGNNIFTPDKEKEICDVYLAGGITRAGMAKKFNCCKTTIREILIRNNIKWSSNG